MDYRTDQFSLGLTLYEMLAGRRAFQADTAPQTLAAIIEDEAESIQKLNPRVPAPVRWVVERCLAKEPRQRYESTTDLARELRTIRDRLGEVASAIGIDQPPARSRKRLTAAALVMAAGAATVAAGAIGAGVTGTADDGLDRYRFTPFATDAGYQSAPAWSPDGKTLAYVAAVDGVLQVFTKAVESPFRAQVTHARFDCHDVFWGPDGTQLYYVSLARDREGLWSISSVGGEQEFVIENVAIRAAVHLVSLEGQPAPRLEPGLALGPRLSGDFRGHATLVFFWAHWCQECKAESPSIARLIAKYEGLGLTLVAPTRRYGYVEGGRSATPDRELRHILNVRDTFYPFLKREPVPVTELNHRAYGVASIPVHVLIDREGVIRLYYPGRMDEADLDAAIAGVLAR